MNPHLLLTRVTGNSSVGTFSGLLRAGLQIFGTWIGLPVRGAELRHPELRSRAAASQSRLVAERLRRGGRAAATAHPLHHRRRTGGGAQPTGG